MGNSAPINPLLGHEGEFYQGKAIKRSQLNQITADLVSEQCDKLDLKIRNYTVWYKAVEAVLKEIKKANAIACGSYDWGVLRGNTYITYYSEVIPHSNVCSRQTWIKTHDI